MIKIDQCNLEDYSFNESGSVKGEKPSRNYPGHPSEISLYVNSIMIEEKTAILKTMNIGDKVTFQINGSVTIQVPNFKLQEDEDVNIPVKGEGTGVIKGMNYFDEECDDDELQEVEIELNDGYAENLVGQ